LLADTFDGMLIPTTPSSVLAASSSASSSLALLVCDRFLLLLLVAPLPSDVLLLLLVELPSSDVQSCDETRGMRTCAGSACRVASCTTVLPPEARRRARCVGDACGDVRRAKRGRRAPSDIAACKPSVGDDATADSDGKVGDEPAERSERVGDDSPIVMLGCDADLAT